MKVIAKALAAAAVVVATSSAANASVIVGGNTYNDGQSFTIYYDGYGGAPAVIPGLTSDITFTVQSHTASSYTLNYLIDNTSTAPITNSRVSVFGFNVDPNYTSASVSGVFDTVNNGNVPNFGPVEFCATSVNCSGGGSGGVFINTPTTMAAAGGTMTLNFNPATANITLSDFVVRYQSIEGAGNVTSAIGRQIDPPAVPEPATWAMMLFGFGAAGVAMRRSRRKLAPVAQLA